jgi:3D (Asp-Asp-Asp) domain-containing protein
VTRPRAASSAHRMTATPSATPLAGRRPRRRKRDRASSPVALVAWGALAALLTFGQLRQSEDADAWVPALASDDADSPFETPFTGPLPWVGVRPVPLPEIVSAPLPLVPKAPAPSPSRALVAARSAPKSTSIKRLVPKRPFAALGQHKVAFASPLLMPRLHLPRVLEPRLGALRGLLSRPRPGEPAVVRLSAYCLRGTTRRGAPVRTGIIAADPRVFPLGRHVELYAAGRYLGRYLVDDTGRHIKGDRIDIWTPDCDDARSFGLREGVAALVALGS